jgi:hypothetical protein
VEPRAAQRLTACRMKPSYIATRQYMAARYGRPWIGTSHRAVRPPRSAERVLTKIRRVGQPKPHLVVISRARYRLGTVWSQRGPERRGFGRRIGLLPPIDLLGMLIVDSDGEPRDAIKMPSTGSGAAYRSAWARLSMATHD